MIGVGSETTVDWIAEQARLPAEADVSFGIGLMAWALERRPELLPAAIAAEPALVSVSFGDPAPFVGPLHDAGIAVATAVNTLADLDRAHAAGVDVIVAQGTEAGGHTGQRATLPLLQEVLAATDRPVLAAGGIATGAGLAAVLVAGAAGGWIGTPFLSCVEATNSPAARERIRAASGDRTVLTSAFDIALGLPWPARWPGRALVNEFTETWQGREDELRGDTRAAEEVRRARREGDVEHSPVYAGESVGLVTNEESATDVVRRLTVDAQAALERAARLLR
jgi:nitronate monooxygenase